MMAAEDASSSPSMGLDFCPEIVSLSSCSSSSLSNTSTVSPANPETLTSLLLQIQQLHTSELQTLQEKADRWKRKCAKFAEISNKNAQAASRFYKHNKILVVQVTDLKCKLKALQNPRFDEESRSEVPKEAPSSDKATASVEHSHVHINQNEVFETKTLQNEAQSTKSSKPLSKLTSKKSRKKVRYSEISSTVGTSNTKGHTNRPVDLLGREKVRAAVPDQDARILALDTCPSPTMHSSLSRINPGSVATPSGHDNTKLSPAGHESRKAKGGHKTTVPETLGVSVSDVTILDLTDECMEAPAFESTPVRGQSQKPREIADLSILPETPTGQKLLAISIPKSESQYPVDLYSTQVKSPTFCGESVMTTPGIADGTAQHFNKPAVPGDIPTPLKRERMHSIDDSCEAEASILLLGRKETGSEKVGFSDQEFQQEERMSNETRTTSLDTKLPTAEFTEGHWMSHSKKRRHDFKDPLSDLTYDETVLPDATNYSKENSLEGLDDSSSLASPNLIRTREILAGEKVKVPEMIGMTRGKGVGMKPLQQSKLGGSMFKPRMNKSTSLMRRYNSGDLISAHVDSQSDRYLNQAIEHSLVDQKEAGNSGMDGTKGSVFKKRRLDSVMPEGLPVGFKVPSVPQQKRRLNSGSPKVQMGHLPYSLDFTSSPQDLNGSIDPLMDLTRMESDEEPSPSKPGPKKLPGRGRQDTPDQAADFRRAEEGDDSCVDLFDEEEEDEEDDDDEEEQEEAGEEDFQAWDDDMDRSKDGIGTGYIKNFDKVPEKNEQPNFKYTEVVRKRDDRQKLKGFGCKECDEFYGNLLLTDAEREVRMKECSRHRAQFSPPNTPDHYWSIGFPDTQTCIQRGYINEGGSSDRRTRKKTKNKYKKLFPGKEVGDDVEENLKKQYKEKNFFYSDSKNCHCI